MFCNSREAALRVALLAGGDSAEREISLSSGASVAQALQQAGHRVTAIDPRGCPIEQVDWRDFDACFIALHGGAGEDGRVQRRLDEIGIAYTGSGPQASRLAMSKSAAKQRFFMAGLPTLPFAVFQRCQAGSQIAERARTLGYPLVAKPDAQGSSLGVAVAETAAELSSSVVQALGFDDRGLLEPFVAGREFTVSVLGREPLPLIEIRSPERLFSFDAKYRRAAVSFHFDFLLSNTLRQALASLAVDAAASLDTRGLVRVDLMLDAQQSPWVLEVNTIPGMTDHSLAPAAAMAAGWTMPRLCDRLLRDCLTAGGSQKVAA